MRVELMGHFKPCMTDIYLHIDARMADYIRTHPYADGCPVCTAVRLVLRLNQGPRMLNDVFNAWVARADADA